MRSALLGSGLASSMMLLVGCDQSGLGGHQAWPVSSGGASAVESRPAHGRRASIPAWTGGYSGLRYLADGAYGEDWGWRNHELGAERAAIAPDGPRVLESRQRLVISNGQPREYSTFRWFTTSP